MFWWRLIVPLFFCNLHIFSLSSCSFTLLKAHKIHREQNQNILHSLQFTVTKYKTWPPGSLDLPWCSHMHQKKVTSWQHLVSLSPGFNVGILNVTDHSKRIRLWTFLPMQCLIYERYFYFCTLFYWQDFLSTFLWCFLLSPPTFYFPLHRTELFLTYSFSFTLGVTQISPNEGKKILIFHL